jgi:ADP-heptose:LPS heptosyltransferase
MIFDLIKICNIPFDENTAIDISLPQKRISLIPLNKVLVTIHLSDKWINKFYTEENFLNLILQLPKKKYIYALTTDNSTNNKFNKIYNNFKIIDNKKFISIKKLKDHITILDKLHYENWIHVIYSSNQVITPECGCTHIASACKVPVIIVYDSDNLPEAIYKEYHPWKSQHKRLVFDDRSLNKNIINNLA